MSRAKLGPPRGAEDTRTALLAERFAPPPAEPAAPAPTPAPAPAVERAPRPPAAAPAGRGRAGTRTPEGMVRRTYYLSRATAAELDAAVDRIVTGTGGLVSRHQALAAVLTAGVGQVDAVLAGLRAELLHHLTPGSDT